MIHAATQQQPREFLGARLERIATRSLLPLTAKDYRLPALTLKIRIHREAFPGTTNATVLKSTPQRCTAKSTK
jgi:hypothetical protein